MSELTHAEHAVIARHLSAWHIAVLLRSSTRGLAVLFDGSHGTGGGGLWTATHRDGIHWTSADSSGVIPWTAVTGLLDWAPADLKARLQSAVTESGFAVQARAKAEFFAALVDEPVGQLDLFALVGVA